MIRKVRKGFKVLSHKGKSLGTYPSYKKALNRLRQVEFFKKLNKSNIG